MYIGDKIIAHILTYKPLNWVIFFTRRRILLIAHGFVCNIVSLVLLQLCLFPPVQTSRQKLLWIVTISDARPINRFVTKLYSQQPIRQMSLFSNEKEANSHKKLIWSRTN